jgi:hypothetical protein
LVTWFIRSRVAHRASTLGTCQIDQSFVSLFHTEKATRDSISLSLPDILVVPLCLWPPSRCGKVEGDQALRLVRMHRHLFVCPSSDVEV